MGYTNRELLKEGSMQLRAAGITEADTDAWLLFSAYMGLNRTEYLMRSDAVVPDDKAEEYLGKLKRRAGREPVQYIEETAPFMGFDFYVNENVLIPRMDTEILVSEAIKRARIMFSQRQHDVSFRILDMCTGSGCIAQSTYLLLKNEGCTVEVDAVDISDKFAGVGGCFPINLKGRGFIGAIAVSGMEQQEDHWLVVDTISQYLGVAVESVLPLFK